MEKELGLELLRQELDRIDHNMVQCFERRMAVCREVGVWKAEHGMSVLDAGREEKVLDSRAAMLKDPSLEADVRELYQLLMRLSRQAQQRLMGEVNCDA